MALAGRLSGDVSESDPRYRLYVHSDRYIGGVSKPMYAGPAEK